MLEDKADVKIMLNESTSNSSDDISENASDSNRINSLRSYNRWSPAEHGATLVWRDLCVYASQGSDTNLYNIKRIINNSTGAIEPGTLMALMGSSGAGKSTLMSALAYRQLVGTVVQGDILINGRRIGPFMHSISGFVHQEDIFVDNITVFEHLIFMAHLRLDRRMPKQEKISRIHDLLERAGLLSSMNTRIQSTIETKALSGGERKRLAFATELLTNPVILFCDEPTTGLDSYSAQQLIQTLHSLALKGTTVMCTIHQPSSQLFSMFHNVLLLADGRVAFMGPPQQALKFFADQGYFCPEAFNPADFLIGVLSTDPGHERASERAAYHLCDLFAVSSAAKQRDLLVNLEFHMAETSNYPFESEGQHFKKSFWITTTYLLCYRHILSMYRNPTVPALKILQKIAIAFMAGACFAGSIAITQLGIQAVQGALFIMISENTFHPMYSVLAHFPQGLPLFLREKRSGVYSTAQYYVSIIISMLPTMVLEPFLFVLVCYWLGGLRPTFYAFMMTVLLVTLLMNAATACGFFFSTAFNSVPLAMAYLVPLDYIFMITSGIFIKISTIPITLSWLQYLSWMMYANEALSILQWDGVQNITCFEDSKDLPCLRSGQDVMEKYSFSFDNLYRNIWAMVILYLMFHTLGYIFLWRRAKRM